MNFSFFLFYVYENMNFIIILMLKRNKKINSNNRYLHYILIRVEIY